MISDDLSRNIIKFISVKITADFWYFQLLCIHRCVIPDSYGSEWCWLFSLHHRHIAKSLSLFVQVKESECPFPYQLWYGSFSSMQIELRLSLLKTRDVLHISNQGNIWKILNITLSFQVKLNLNMKLSSWKFHYPYTFSPLICHHSKNE